MNAPVGEPLAGRRSLVPALAVPVRLLLPLVLLGGLGAVSDGCSPKRRTEAIIGIGTDLRAPVPLATIHLRVIRLPELVEVFQNDFNITGRVGDGYELPSSFGIYSEKGDSYRVRVIARAFDNDGKELVTRTAVLSLVPQRTVYLRLGLVSACVGKLDCSEGTTCIEGRCESEAIDARRLPDYSVEVAAEATCTGGTMFRNTSTGEALAMGAGCAGQQASCQEGVCLAPPIPDADGGPADAPQDSAGATGGAAAGGTSGAGGAGSGGRSGSGGSGGAPADGGGGGAGGFVGGGTGGSLGAGTGGNIGTGGGITPGTGGRGGGSAMGSGGAGGAGGGGRGGGGATGTGGRMPGTGGDSGAGTGGEPAPGSGGASAGTGGDSGGGSGGATGTGGASPGTGGASGTGGATGTGGDSGSGGATGTGGASPGTGGAGGAGIGGSDCPGTAGPAMLRLPEGYCVDTTEVTRDQYNAWLATTPPPSTDPRCTGNTDYAPATSPAACGSAGDHPVVCVDWCDAFSYCQAAGKRLCGKIGGGANAYADYASVALSQWYSACTGHGASVYPYPGTYSAATCNGFDNAVGGTVAVASLASCQPTTAGYVGVFDLSGNAWEWEDSCADDSATASCRFRGGSYGSSSSTLRCDSISQSTRTSQSQFVGFRCCAD